VVNDNALSTFAALLLAWSWLRSVVWYVYMYVCIWCPNSSLAMCRVEVVYPSRHV